MRAIVEVNGERREMTFLTNSTKWAASTICELYRTRWEIEVFFKELKQTPQLTDFIGTNENAVKWQIWTGLLSHLLLHYLLSGWNKAFSRLVGIVRSAVWMDLDIVGTLRLYGMASPPHRPQPHYIQLCLAGFCALESETYGIASPPMAAFHRNFGTRQPEKASGSQ